MKMPKLLSYNFINIIGLAAFGLAMMGMAGTAHAALMTATDPVSPTGAFGCQTITCGWSFTVDQQLDVVALGQWDESLDGLPVSAEVGLWLDDGTPLASVTVPSGTSANLIGDFRFVDISTVTLLPSTTYAIGSFFSGGLADGLGNAEFNPLVDPISGRILTTGFGFPSQTGSAFISGPTFRFDDEAIQVSEPSTLGLFALGLAGLGVLNRRRKKANWRGLTRHF